MMEVAKNMSIPITEHPRAGMHHFTEQSLVDQAGTTTDKLKAAAAGSSQRATSCWTGRGASVR
jgi:hypothetical protein